MDDDLTLADFKRGKSGHFRTEHQGNEFLLGKIEQFGRALPAIKNFMGEIALSGRYCRCQNGAAERFIELVADFCLMEDIQCARGPSFSLLVREKPGIHKIE